MSRIRSLIELSKTENHFYAVARSVFFDSVQGWLTKDQKGLL